MKKPNILKFYKTKKTYRWRLMSSNGKTIGAATEGFVSLRGAIKNYLLHRTTNLKVEGLTPKQEKKIKE